MATSLEQRLDEEFTAFVENFVNVVRASSIQAPSQELGQGKGVPGELMEVLAGRLLESGHNLLDMISELKQRVLTSDCLSLRQANNNVLAGCGDYNQQVAVRLHDLRKEVAELVAVLSHRKPIERGSDMAEVQSG